MIENQIVYILSNPSMPNIVKIGKTTQNDVEHRMSQLYSTGVPLPFKCEFAVEVIDCHKAEKALHIAFEPYRVNPKREFFDIIPEQAIAILKLLGTKDMTPNIEAQLNKDVSQAEKSSAKKINRKPSMDYTIMGIDIGSILTYVDDESIVVEVVSNRKVKYNGTVMGLTRANMLVQELDYAIQPSPYWMFEGRLLKEIYDETYSNEDN
jgi:hypothetical protein